jgi:hypothetical protein
MITNSKDKLNSIINSNIFAARMSTIERKAAFKAMHDADHIVNALLWLGRKIEQITAFLIIKPSVKH